MNWTGLTAVSRSCDQSTVAAPSLFGRDTMRRQNWRRGLTQLDTRLNEKGSEITRTGDFRCLLGSQRLAAQLPIPRSDGQESKDQTNKDPIKRLSIEL